MWLLPQQPGFVGRNGQSLVTSWRAQSVLLLPLWNGSKSALLGTHSFCPCLTHHTWTMECDQVCACRTASPRGGHNPHPTVFLPRGEALNAAPGSRHSAEPARQPHWSLSLHLLTRSPSSVHLPTSLPICACFTSHTQPLKIKDPNRYVKVVLPQRTRSIKWSITKCGMQVFPPPLYKSCMLLPLEFFQAFLNGSSSPGTNKIFFLSMTEMLWELSTCAPRIACMISSM